MPLNRLKVNVNRRAHVAFFSAPAAKHRQNLFQKDTAHLLDYMQSQ